MRLLITQWVHLPQWGKTTIASWLSTATGVGLFDWLSSNQGAIQSLAAIIGGILIPFIALLYTILKKKP